MPYRLMLVALVALLSFSQSYANGYDDEEVIRRGAQIIHDFDQAKRQQAGDGYSSGSSGGNPYAVGLIFGAILIWWLISRSNAKHNEKLLAARREFLTKQAGRKGFKSAADIYIDAHAKNLIAIDRKSKTMLYIKFINDPEFHVIEKKLADVETGSETFRGKNLIEVTKINDFKISVNTDSLDNPELVMHYAIKQHETAAKLYSQLLALQHNKGE